jgi:hypothetical protein
MILSPNLLKKRGFWDRVKIFSRKIELHLPSSRCLNNNRKNKYQFDSQTFHFFYLLILLILYVAAFQIKEKIELMNILINLFQMRIKNGS